MGIFNLFLYNLREGENVAKQVRKKIKKSIIFKSFSFVFFLVSVIALFLLGRLGVLPWKYFIFLGVFVLVLNFLIYRLVGSKHWLRRMFGCGMSFVMTIVMIVGIFYESVTLGFFQNAFQSREKIENYQVLVLNTSNYGSLKEFKNGKIGLPNTNFSDGAKELQNEIKKRTSLTIQEGDNASNVEALLSKNLRVIVMEEAQKNIFCEINDDFKNQVKVIETIPIKVKNNVKRKDVAITKNPFHVYLSGSDDYGTINQVSRSDVNMILTVNPKNHQVLLTSIPRDYYVSLEGMNEAKDKITHASLYGIDTSMKTLDHLLGIDIDYYLKINFSSLVNLVEAVGGVDIEVTESFTAHYYDEPVDSWVTYDFTKGMNHMNGKQALAYSRERKSFVLGDRTRAIHQQMVLSALIQKVASPAILKNYTSILNALDGSFDTNLGFEDIMSFLQKQLDDGGEWSIDTFVLEGTDANKPIYSMKGYTSYVMIPKEESVEKAKTKLKEFLEN